jgi:hypothetical protein
MKGLMGALRRHPGLRADLEWMEKDEVTQRFIAANPGSRDSFERFKASLLGEK